MNMRFRPMKSATRPADQQQASEGQGVRRQGPLAVGERDVQGALRRREGDGHHRSVQDDHQLGDGDHGQRPEASGVRFVPYRGRGLEGSFQSGCHQSASGKGMMRNGSSVSHYTERGFRMSRSLM